MFEATGWKLEEPEVVDQQKYDLIVPTIVKCPTANDHHDDGVSKERHRRHGDGRLLTQKLSVHNCLHVPLPHYHITDKH